jgi:hypothetical protein
MAAIGWITSEFVSTLPLHGIVMDLVKVGASISLAAIVFYFSCRLLRVEELQEAIDAIAGRLLRVLQRR